MGRYPLKLKSTNYKATGNETLLYMIHTWLGVSVLVRNERLAWNLQLKPIFKCNSLLFQHQLSFTILRNFKAPLKTYLTSFSSFSCRK